MPEAEPLVQRYRLRLDPSAAVGVPAHVTLLHPFLEPERLGPAVRDRLVAVISAEPAFEFDLAGVDRFGDTVLYLAPEPAEPFRRLMRRLSEEFGLLPYSGEHPDLVPHLTVAQHAERDAAAAMARSLAAGLPISCRAAEVALLAAGPDGRWRRLAVIPLGTPQQC